MKLKTKFVLWITPILFVPLIVTLWVSVFQFNEMDKKTANLIIDVKSQEVEKSFEVLLESVRVHLDQISTFTEVSTYLDSLEQSNLTQDKKSALEALFATYLSDYEHYQGISLLLPQDSQSVYHSIDQNQMLSQQELTSLNNELKKEKIAINVVKPINVMKQPIEGGFNIQFSMRVNGKSKAILSIYIKKEYLTSLIFDHRVGSKSIVLVTGADHKILTAPSYDAHSDYIEYETWLELISINEAELIQDQFGFIVEQFDLTEKFGFVMIWPKKSSIEILLTDGLQNIILGFLTFFAVIIIINSFIKNEVLKPIERLINYTQLAIKGGTSQPYEISNDEIGNLSRSFIQLGDDLYQSSKKMEQLAFYDALTGLANRNKFLTCLEESINEAKATQQQLGLVFLDLDGFKEVNDTLGHDAGDSVLKQVADRLQHSLDQFHLSAPNEEYIISNVSRLGGDEFTLIVNNFNNDDVLKQIAQFILNGLEAPFLVDSERFYLSCSIGLVLFPVHGMNTDMLLKNADTAMYQSKSLGKNQYQFYKQELTEITMLRYKLKSALRDAIKNEELFLTYQPQLDFSNKKIIGCEALIRWIHPELGAVSPVDFIHLAEESDLILEIGEWVIEQSAIMASRINKENLDEPIKIAVNVSSVQLMRSNVPGIISHHIENNNLPQNAIEIEITESIMIDKGFRTEKSLSDIQKMGIDIALDDFGTGYSSLSQIKDLPLNTIKIDKAFIRNCSENEKTKNIVLAIIAMNKQLGFKTTAEGIETKEEFEFLNASGCDFAQGYAISHPLKEAQFIEYIKHFNYDEIFKS